MSGARRALPFAWPILLVPLIASAAVRGFWAPDEPRYAEVAREIYEPGHGERAPGIEREAPWLVMHLCGEVYPDKPPLLFWLSGGLGALSGWNELAMRLPSLLACAGTALLVHRLARRWWGTPEASWAPALLLATIMVTEIGGRLQIDPLLTFLCTASITLAEMPAETKRGAAWLVLAAGFLVGLAALTKGPVAYVNVGLPVLLWRTVRRRDKGESATAASRAAAIALAVLPVLAWASSVAVLVPGIARDLFYGQHLERAALGTHHRGPIWKLFLTQPLFLLPWTPAVLGGLALALRSLRRESEDAGSVKAALWFLGLFAFYSIIPAKRDLYLLPAYPAAALLAARFLSTATRASLLEKLTAWCPPVLLVLAGLALALLPFAVKWIPDVDEMPGLGWRGPAAGTILLAVGVQSLLHTIRVDPSRWARTVLTGWAAGSTGVALLLFPAIDTVKSPRDLATRIAARPQKPSAIPCVSVHPEGYRFYGDIPAVEAVLSDLQDHLASEGSSFLALIPQSVWRNIPLEEQLQYRSLLEERVGSREIIVLGSAERSVR